MHLSVLAVRERIHEPEGMLTRFRIELIQEYSVGGIYFSCKFQFRIA
jgi:hypothetical protein